MSKTTPKTELPPADLEQARVMFREGFLEDAKKIARAWIRSESSSEVIHEAQKLLSEIEDSELKQVLRTSGTSRRKSSQETETVLTTLLSRLQIRPQDLMSETPFESPEEEIDFGIRLRKVLPPEELKTQLDLLIALREMEFHRAVLVLGRWVHDQAVSKNENILRVTAKEFLAESWFELGEYVQSRSELESIVMDSDLEESLKINAYFLMGLSFEEEGAIRDAVQWYSRCLVMESDFRDAKDRIRRLSGGA